MRIIDRIYHKVKHDQKELVHGYLAPWMDGWRLTINTYKNRECKREEFFFDNREEAEALGHERVKDPGILLIMCDAEGEDGLEGSE